MISILKRAKSLLKNKAIVLMYHRITTERYDPWDLCVSPENFEEQVKSLQLHYNVISVEELMMQLQNKNIKHKSVCITFDDGYTDNYLHAKPILEKYNSPATFFIASNYISSGVWFWWDLLEDIILASTELPPYLALHIEDHLFEYYLKTIVLNDAEINLIANWKWPADPPNDRCSLYLAIWEKLLPLDYTTIKMVIAQLKSWAQYNPPLSMERLPMTLDQLTTFSDSGLFQLGIHTSSHAALNCHNLAYQQKEMSACKAFLSANIKNTVSAIAYPYGRYNNDSIRAATITGITAAFTTNGVSVSKSSDMKALGRMQVCNWDAKTFDGTLKNWFKH